MSFDLKKKKKKSVSILLTAYRNAFCARASASCIDRPRVLYLDLQLRKYLVQLKPLRVLVEKQSSSVTMPVISRRYAESLVIQTMHCAAAMGHTL